MFQQIAEGIDLGPDDDNGPSGKRPRPDHKQDDPEWEQLFVEFDTALHVGLQPVMSAEEEEYCTRLRGKHYAEYFNIRNAIHALWRKDVSSWLHLRDVMQHVPEKLRPVAEVAYEFLWKQGFINFGLSEAILTETESVRKQLRATWAPQGPRRVVVVGAGLAGLAAARHLYALGHEVIILEARERSGGRVHTLPLQHGTFFLVFL